MSASNSDQGAHSERALKEKIKKEEAKAPTHPSPGKTSDEGFQPVDREKIIDVDEKANG